ncbi:MAG TPA: alpha/beta fold hydrolase [Streptosporangiaceae bacterium]|nr:alpha/beta fold hydrolase [Streptosporangiaceae bacterium]
MTSFRHPGTVLTGHTFSVPLDHTRPDGEQIEIFAREVVGADRAAEAASLPWLLFLQGGPGNRAPRPVGRETWLDRALKEFRVLLLDQRGTGRSTPADRLTLAKLAGPQAQADYLALFRADNIVRDAERIRRQLTGGAPWSVLGQSFGGFCTVTYLSLAPEGIREAFITGGLPGLDVTADDVYRAAYPRVAAKVSEHYGNYPDDVGRARDIARYLARHEVRLPAGMPLTVENFQSLGRMLGMSTGSPELHYLLEDAFSGGELTDQFLYQAEHYVTFAPSPLYAVLHEACYAQGGATGWSAQRVRAEFPAFDPAVTVDGDGPLTFTGEMIYPWMTEHDPALRPLRAAADRLAARDGWPRLYDQVRLAANEVPAAAAIYFGDMYVDRDDSLRAAASIKGLRQWVTSEYEHDGVRVSGGRVLDRLIALTRGES